MPVLVQVPAQTNVPGTASILYIDTAANTNDVYTVYVKTAVNNDVFVQTDTNMLIEKIQ